MANQRMKLTGAATLVSRGMKVLRSAPAAYPFRYAVAVRVPHEQTEDLSMARSRILGIAGAILLTVGVFLPSLSFQFGTASLWESHRWTASVLLGTAGVTLFICGGGAYRSLIHTGIGAMIVTAVRLLTIIWSIESRLVENAEFAKREPGWAGLAAMGIPKVHWLGWAILVLGSTLILIAGLWSLPNRRFNPTCAPLCQ